MSSFNCYIALLRGINVGSHNRIKMGDLRQLLESLGLKKVQTYLASGNIVFETDKDSKVELAETISTSIETSHGFKPAILLLTFKELQQATKTNPFPKATSEPKYLHFGFLASKPKDPDIQKLENLKKENERFELNGKVFYLHAPDGVGRSKLAANSEKALGVPMTDRNFRTVTKIIKLAGG